jgi:hypothetical protein
MSSLVTEEHWREYFGDTPMPEETNSDMLWAAIEAMETMEHRDNDIKDIESHTKSLEHYNRRLELAKSRGEPTETIENIIKLIEETIELYRSCLND